MIKGFYVFVLAVALRLFIQWYLDLEYNSLELQLWTTRLTIGMFVAWCVMAFRWWKRKYDV